MSNIPPAWIALTNYLAGARVTPVTADGTVWEAANPGQTGAAEPTWPTAEPWTVTDGGVTWGKASSFRQQAVAGLIATLTTFRAANPTLLRGIAAARPQNLTTLDTPGAYIASRDEIDAHSRGVRTRTLPGLAVVVVDIVPDNAEAESRMDPLIDGLMDAFTAAFHAANATSLTQQTQVAEIDLDEGGVHYLANVITFGQTSMAEGRT